MPLAFAGKTYTGVGSDGTAYSVTLEPDPYTGLNPSVVATKPDGTVEFSDSTAAFSGNTAVAFFWGDVFPYAGNAVLRVSERELTIEIRDWDGNVKPIILHSAAVD